MTPLVVNPQAYETDVPWQLHASNYQGIDSLEADLTADVGTFQSTFAPEDQDETKAKKNMYDSMMMVMMFAESLFFSGGMLQTPAPPVQSGELSHSPYSAECGGRRGQGRDIRLHHGQPGVGGCLLQDQYETVSPTPHHRPRFRLLLV